jgi:hypothetical protein
MHAGNPKLLFRVPHPFPRSLRKGWAPVSRRRNRFSAEHSIGQKGAAWKETILYSLPTAKQGYLPNGDLVFDSAGDVYAATISCSLFSIYAEMKVFLNLSSAPECVRRPGRGVNLINPKRETGRNSGSAGRSLFHYLVRTAFTRPVVRVWSAGQLGPAGRSTEQFVREPAASAGKAPSSPSLAICPRAPVAG